MGDFSRKNRILDMLAAGALTAVILLAAFYREGIVPFGSNTLAVTDTNVQYLDLFAYYRDVLTGQNTIGSTFSYMLGTGMAGVFAYYLASPFLLLVAFFPKEQMNLFLSVLVLLKLSAAAMTFRWFLQRRLVSVPGGVSDRVLGRGSERNYGNTFPPNRRPGTGRLKGKPQNSRPQSNGSDSRQVNRSQRGSGTLAPAAALVLSVSYGLMQYNLAQAGNVMWLDGVILLPVMLLYVSEIVRGSVRRSVRYAGGQTGSRANLQAGDQTGSRTSRWARDQAGKRAGSRANLQAGDQTGSRTSRWARDQAGKRADSRANRQAGDQTGSWTSRWARDQAGKRADSRANRQAGDQSSWQSDRRAGKRVEAGDHIGGRAGSCMAGLCKLAVVTGMGLMFSWYTGAINCLFSLVWFVYESVRAKSFRGAKHFFAGLMLGGLLSCVVMVPNWMALRLGKGAEPVQAGAFDLGWIGNPLSILTYYKIGAMSDAYHVSLYCGVLAAVGAAAFLVLAGRRERRAALGLLIFVVLMYYWKPLIYVFSLLRKVDSYWSRYGYLGCFVLLYFAAEGLARLDAVLPEAVKRLPAREETGDAAQAERAKGRPAWVETGDASQAERAAERRDWEETGDAAQAERAKKRLDREEAGDAAQAETMGRRTDRSFGWRRAAGVVLVALVSVNLFLEASAMINIYHSDTAQEYAKYARRAAKQVASIKDYDASPFYRINETSTRIYNVDGLTSAYQDPLAYGYSSVGGYTSCPENAQLAFLESIGYREEYDSFNIVSTAFLPADSLLGVRYELSGEALPGLTELPSLGRRNQKSVYYNSYALPAAMLADAGDGAAEGGAWEAVEAGEWEAAEAGEWEAAEAGAGEATEAGARSETGEDTQPAANDDSQPVKGEENQPAAGNGSQSTSDDASRLNAGAAAGKRAEVRSARWVKPEVTNRQSKVFETLEELYSNLYGEPAGLFVPVEAASQWQDGRMIWTLQVPEGNVAVYGNLLWDEEFVGKLSVQEGMRHGYGMWLSPSVFWIPVTEHSGSGTDRIDGQNAAMRAGSGSEETDSKMGNGTDAGRGDTTAQITLECDDPSSVTQAQFYALDLERFRVVTDRIRSRSEKAVQILTWNGREIRVAVKAEAADAVRSAQSVDTEITTQSSKAANTTQSAKAGNTKSADETEAAERQSSSRILILSAANSPGWTVFCNGEKVEPETFGGCMVQIPLPAGEAEIEMRYRTPGQMPGIVLSVVGAACLILLRTLRPTICIEKAGGRRTQVVAETDDMHQKGGGSSDTSRR